MMNDIKEILSVENIFLDENLVNIKKLFKKIGIILEEKYNLNQKEIMDSLFDREKLGSIAIGGEVAMLHLRLSQMAKITGIFIRLKDSMQYDTPDNKPIKIVFILLFPIEESKKDNKLISFISEKLLIKENKEKFFQYNSNEEIVKIFDNNISPAN